MRTRDILEGKPLRMPLHIVLVHFPIALLILSVLLDIGGHVAGGSNALVRSGFYALTAGVIGAVVAAIPGLVDYTTIRHDHSGRTTAIWHMVLNIAAVGLFAISLVLRWRRLDALHAPLGPFVLSIAGSLIILVSGYLGGILVYDHGIGVGRHRRRTPLPKRTLKARTDQRDSMGFVPVADEAALEEGQTLRVDAGGTMLALVRSDGQVYAFQEFCTHRYGPLSEGCFEDGQVRCPWHNSQFDLGSGKVTHAPAKVDLKVFETQIREGRIWVRSMEVRAPQEASAAG